MKKRIYLSLLAMGIACILITVAVASYFFYHSTSNQVQNELVREMAVISDNFVQSGNSKKYLASVAKDSNDMIRLTWIGTDGVVLYESNYDVGKMENHKERPEVQAAITAGSGSDIRISRTIDRNAHYYAQRLPDNTVLRVAMDRENVYAALFNLVPAALGLIILLLIACLWVSSKLTDLLLEPIEKTVVAMQQIGNGENSDIPKPYHAYRELQPMLQKVVDQNEEINHTIETLEQERNTIHLIMEQMQEGLVLINEGQQVMGINRWAKEYFDVPETMILRGRQASVLSSEQYWLRFIEETLREKLPLEKVVSADDRIYHIGSRTIDRDGKPYGALIMITDVTESERREQLRREFTANVSHELKTPLTSISGFAEMIAVGLYDDKTSVVEFAQRIQTESQRLMKLIEGIIHLARIEDAAYLVQLGVVDLKKMIASIISFMEPVWTEKGVLVQLDGDEGLVEGNEPLLRELCMNLIDNAIKYNHINGTVRIFLKKKTNKIALTVQDTGIGIPADKQHQVFERFYRVDQSRTKATGGSGLGLSIVKHIVESHHGEIRLESKEHEGTTITVLLKAAQK